MMNEPVIIESAILQHREDADESWLELLLHQPHKERRCIVRVPIIIDLSVTLGQEGDPDIWMPDSIDAMRKDPKYKNFVADFDAMVKESAQSKQEDQND